MTRRAMRIVSSFSLLALVVVLMPFAGVQAQDPPIDVNGLFYGDPADRILYQHELEDIGRGNLYSYYDEPNGKLYIAMVVLPSVNDNVFGLSKFLNDPLYPDAAYVFSAGWKQLLYPTRVMDHNLDRLVKSDMFEFRLVCADGGPSYHWRQDLVYWDSTAGKWLSGVDGPDGNILCTDPGDPCLPPPGLETASSTAWNLNYDLDPTSDASHWDPTLGGNRGDYPTWKSVDTPAPFGDNNVQNEGGWDPDNVLTDVSNIWWNSQYNWEWTLTYEASMDVDTACSGHDWDIEVVAAHNSPAKTPNENVTPEYFDYGDLPDDLSGFPDYPTYFESNGARHQLIEGGPKLGLVVDKEGTGWPTDDALGDDYWDGDGDDEDGVIPSEIIPGQDFTVHISVSSVATNAYLDVWFDFNNDGILADTDTMTEYFRIPVDSTTSDFDYDFYAPEDTHVGYVYARFRISIDGINTPYGAAPDGEVEDYRFVSRPPLSAFMGPQTATAFVNAVRIEWESLNELNTIGYNVERALSPDGPWTQLNGSLIRAETGGLLGASYDFVDPDVEPGDVYYYRVVSLSTSAAPTYYEAIKAVVPTIGEPYAPYVPPSPASIHRAFLPVVNK